MPESDLARLVDVIDHGIVARDIYLLMDARLDLICGADTLERIDSPEVKQRISEFPHRHGWSVTRSESGILFVPATGEMDFSNF